MTALQTSDLKAEAALKSEVCKAAFKLGKVFGLEQIDGIFDLLYTHRVPKSSAENVSSKRPKLLRTASAQKSQVRKAVLECKDRGESLPAEFTKSILQKALNSKEVSLNLERLREHL